MEMTIEFLPGSGARELVKHPVSRSATPERVHAVTARRGRKCRMLLAGIATALILAGSVSAPAEARPTFNQVFGETQNCLLMNGDPYLYEWGDAIFVVCLYEDGSASAEYLP